MYISANYVIGATCGIVSWIMVIVYFCFRSRQRPSKDMIIMNILIEAFAPKIREEEKLRKSFAKTKGKNEPQFWEGDMLKTYKMEGRWIPKIFRGWDEENVKQWSEEESDSSQENHINIIDLENVFIDETPRRMGKMFTQTFGKYPVTSLEYGLGEQNSASLHSGETTLAQKFCHSNTEELTNNSLVDSVVSDLGLCKTEEMTNIISKAKPTPRTSLINSCKDKTNTIRSLKNIISRENRNGSYQSESNVEK